MEMWHRHYVKEEIINSALHFCGFGLAVAALVVLVVLGARSGDPWRVVSFAIYGATLVMLYASSMFFHGFVLEKHRHLRDIFRVVDHSTIFFLIAGTYTPFMLVAIRGGWGWSIFGVIWGLAVLGVIFKISSRGNGYNLLSCVIYLVMGWLILLALGPMLESITGRGLMWLFLGGGLYTVGVVFYLMKRVPFSHTIWHLFVLGGSICHFFGILFYVL